MCEGKLLEKKKNISLFSLPKISSEPPFSAPGCHLSSSLVESVKMHSIVSLRLSHVSLLLMQAIKPVGFFPLTKIQSD